MKRYKIANKHGEVIYKFFKDATDCRHWIINHLDLSEEWDYNRYRSDGE